ncbi:MAG TPA: pirin family protein [Polyangia bacterium]|nr:pirin family protein [Polyangia bacterium]
MSGAGDTIELTISGRARSLGGGIEVRRLLPVAARRMVGPLIFFDHFGPLQLPPGQGMDVRPHPHIGLCTVTYLFEGAIVHRDSLGSLQTIAPGDVNWMNAGRGIVHSERSGPDERARGARMHGLQLWMALPTADEDGAPWFQHHPAAALPALEGDDVTLRVIAGSAYGQTAPVRVSSPMFYVDASLRPGAVVTLPDDHPARALYVVEGSVVSDGISLPAGQMAVYRPDVLASAQAPDGARVVLVGGAPLDGQRHIDWNFVSSQPERIDRARRDWKEGRFPKVPGDESEFIPLP